MNKLTQLIFALFLVVYLIAEQAIAATLPCENEFGKAAIPQDAYFLPEDQASQLQSALDTYKKVRLKPAGNYRKSLLIKLSSNQELYGLVGTKLPQVIIPEGTNNAILSGVNPGLLTFEGFTKPITNNCFNKIINTKILAQNALIDNNVFTDLSNIRIDIDNTQKGYLRNNRFIRTLSHAYSPSIKIIGDDKKQSYGNLFVWTNILIPSGDSIIIKNQRDIAFIGIEAETWNLKKQAQYPGMLNISNTDFLSVTTASGSDYLYNVGQYFNLDVKDIIIQGTTIRRTKNPGIILGKNVENLFTFNIKNIGLTKANASTRVVDYYYNQKPEFYLNGNLIQQNSISTTVTEKLNTLLEKQKSIYSNWDEPHSTIVKSPVSSNWQTLRTSQPDSSDQIQALINKNGIAELKAGIYYLSKPLVLKRGQGIIGAGMAKTALVAKSSNMDIIVGGDHITGNRKTTYFILADITLQGGRNGIHFSPAGIGNYAQFNLSTISHVAFRNMNNAGIFANNIFGMDNNYLDYVQFVDSKSAVKQYPDPNFSGGIEKAGMTFLDKNIFYNARFENNELALDWPAKRANNLNSFVSSTFINNGKIILQKMSNTTYFANSVFENNAGNPSVDSNTMIGFIKSDFSTSKKSSVILDDYAFCIGCKFHDITNGASLMTGSGVSNFFMNSTIPSSQQLTFKTGLVVNNTTLP